MPDGSITQQSPVLGLRNRYPRSSDAVVRGNRAVAGRYLGSFFKAS
jgi:hypothetical protein